MSEQNSKISEMLDHLVNDDSAKAEELFHEYVVEKSREIYEGLIESEIEDEEVDEATDEDDEAVEEASEESDDEEIEESAEDDDEEVEEGFDEVDVEEGDDEGDDATDAFMKDVEGGEDEEGEEGEEGDEDEEATKGDIMDLKTAIEDLEAAFKEYAGGEEAGEDEMEMDSFAPEFESEETDDLETVREYVEKVDGHGAEKKGKAETADNTASPVAGANDMGGTTANIAKGGEGGGSETGLAGKVKDMNTKNINKVGGSSESERMSKNGAGHGAERKGTGEGSADATSIIGSK